MKTYKVTLFNALTKGRFSIEMEGFDLADIERQVKLYNPGFEVIKLTSLIHYPNN